VGVVPRCGKEGNGSTEKQLQHCHEGGGGG